MAMPVLPTSAPIRHPARSGKSLVEQLQIDQPALYAKLAKVIQDNPRDDFKSSHYAKRRPARSGRRFQGKEQ